MSDPFVGQIFLFPFNFPPKGYAFCQGQILPISQNTPLFSLLLTTYGGDGKSTFALPNLQGRVPLGFGQGPGLSNYVQGETNGSDTVMLLTGQLPAHAHPLASTLTATATCRSAPGNQMTPVGSVPASEATSGTAPYSGAAPDANMNGGAIVVSGPSAPAGGDAPHANLQPYLTLNYCIALQGVFPARS